MARGNRTVNWSAISTELNMVRIGTGVEQTGRGYNIEKLYVWNLLSYGLLWHLQEIF